MAQFAKSSFDAAGYLASRPTYPARVYDTILAYHRARGGRFDHALDLGCGPGFMAANLAPHFAQVTGLDPSQRMVDVGQQAPPAPPIAYRVGSAEDLAAADVAEASVDLVVAGQAAHWFDHARVWPQLARILRPRGTVAYVGYGEIAFPAYPRLDALVDHYHHADDAVGPYWSQPGRSIVEGLLDAVPFPVAPPCPPAPALRDLLAGLPDVESASPADHPVPDTIDEPPATGDVAGGWDAASATRLKAGTAGPWGIHRAWDASELEAYFRTSSALNAYHAAHPEDKAARGRGGDIVDRLMATLTAELKTEGINLATQKVHVRYPLILLLLGKA